MHRDLKPSNILLADDGTPKITDFGLAKLLDDDSGLTGSDEAPGTPSYMAPEQATGSVSPAVDIYALGTMLYEMLTGRPPFLAATAIGTLDQVRSAEPVSPRLLVPRIPRDLETICLKCLEKSPTRRYLSAASLADELGRFLDGRPIAARPVGPIARLGRWARRQPVIAGLATVSACLLSAVAIVSVFAAVRVNESRAVATDAANKATEWARRETIAREAMSRALKDEQSSRERAQLAEKQTREKLETTEQISKFLGDLFGAADPLGLDQLGFRTPDTAAGDMTARDLVDRGRRMLDEELKDKPEVRGALLARLGSVYFGLGLLDQANELLAEALLALRQSGRDSEDLAAALQHWGRILLVKGQYRESETALRANRSKCARRLFALNDPRVAKSIVSASRGC